MTTRSAKIEAAIEAYEPRAWKAMVKARDNADDWTRVRALAWLDDRRAAMDRALDALTSLESGEMVAIPIEPTDEIIRKVARTFRGLHAPQANFDWSDEGIAAVAYQKIVKLGRSLSTTPPGEG